LIETAEKPARGRRPRSRSIPERVAAAPPAVLLFAAAAALSAGVLLYLGSHLTFLLDDWDLLLFRRGFSADVIFTPHNENIVVLPTLAYKALLAIFGMDSAQPFRVLSTSVFIVSVALLFVWLRHRVGAWLALAGAVSILFLGAAWEDLLWPFQLGYFGSMSCGLGMLLALERGDRRGDLIACGLLVASLAFSSVGLPFAAAAAVALALGPRGRLAPRAFVVAVPVALFGLWWLGWGREAENAISLANIASSPLYVIDGFASALSSLFGTATPRDELAYGPLEWGRPLVAGAVLLAAWRLQRLGRMPPGLLVVGALALSFWLLAGFNEQLGREATASRYTYIGAIFVLMIAAELLRGVRLRAPALLAVFALLAVTVASNLAFLHQQYLKLETTGEIELASLGAIEIARDTVDPAYRLDDEIAGTPVAGVQAGPYLSAVDDLGSPALALDEIAAAPEQPRLYADLVLSRALRVTFTPRSYGGLGAGVAPTLLGTADGGQATTEGGCLELDRSPRRAPRLLELAPGGAVIEAPGGAAVDARLRRFATASFPVEAGRVPGRSVAVLAIPPDRAPQWSWQLELTSAGPIRVCGLAGS